MNRYLSSITMLGMMAIFACGGADTAEPIGRRPIKIEKVKKWNHISRFYTGGVESKVYANLAFPFAGPLVSLPVERGSRILKGSLVASLDPLNQRSNYETKRAAYLNAKSQWERNSRLLEKKVVSKQEYELSEAAFQQAKTAYKIAENQLLNTELRAPFDGIVTQKYVENYQRVEAGETVVRLMDPKRMEVVFLLPETDVKLLEKAWQVEVEFATDSGQWFVAVVEEVVDASLDGSGIPVRLKMTDSLFQQGKYPVLPGLSCRIRITINDEREEGGLVPLPAIAIDGLTHLWWVWRYDSISSRVYRQAVVADGVTNQAEVRIVSGIRSGDWIVVSGGNFLTEGEQVKVITP